MTIPGEVTDPSLVEATEVSLEGTDAQLRAYLARPAMPGLRPGIVVIHEAMGLNDHIADVARRFANVGFDALAPDLYSRTGPPDASSREELFASLFALPDEQAVADLGVAIEHLRGLDQSTGQIGCVGFCSGGRHTLLAACSDLGLGAAIDCWGGFIDRATPDDDRTPTRPTPVIDMVDHLGCPLLAVGGAEDQNPSPETMAELERRLESVAHPTEVQVFAGAGHAFFADYRPSYREGPAHELWPRMVEFFDRHLR